MENIEEKLCSWKDLLNVMKKTADSANENLSKESKVEDQSSQESAHIKVANPQNWNFPGLSYQSLMVMCWNSKTSVISLKLQCITMMAYQTFKSLPICVQC